MGMGAPGIVAVVTLMPVPAMSEVSELVATASESSEEVVIASGSTWLSV